MEAQVGAPLPLELGALLERVRPGDPLFFGSALLDPAELLRHWTVHRDVYESMELADLKQHISSPRGYVYPVYTCPRWVPFLEKGQAFLCLDLVPGKKGNYGQVIAMGEDLDHRPVIAPSLSRWVELCTRKAAGEHVRVLPV
ncbi:MAG: SMI1/KNR4 family protein [Planctomycetes bacterium]|nr:SMI1/KNR4 family protein [Planctomycetota bacterium]